MTVGQEALDVITSINEIIVALALIGVGMVLCFWGGRFARKIIFLIGFFAGALFTYLCLNNVAAASTSKSVHLLISCGVGLAIGFICMWVYVSAIFVLGAIAGVIFGQLLWHVFVWRLVSSSSSSYVDLIFVIFCGLIGGFLAFYLEKIFMKGLTAFTGSFMAISGFSFFVMKYIVKEDSTNVFEYRNFFNKSAVMHNTEGLVTLIVWLVLFCCGACYQYGWYKYLGIELSKSSSSKPNNKNKTYEQFGGEKQIHVHINK